MRSWMGADQLEDFKFKHGTIGKGIVAASIAGVLLIVIPVVLILIFRSRMSDPVLGSELLSLIQMIALLGIPVAVASFFRAFYRKGSLARMTFGLAETGLVLLYLSVLLLSSNLQRILELLQYQVDLTGVYLALLYLVTIRAFGFVCEFFWFREDWLKSINAPIAAKPPLKENLALDFSLRVGIPPEGQREARSKLLLLIVIPALLLLLIPPAVSALIDLPLEAQRLFTILADIVGSLLLLGLPLLPIAWLRGFYPKGSFGRLVFSLAYVLFLIVYIYLVLAGHGLNSWFLESGVHFDYDLMVLLVMIIPAFLAIEALGELIDERKPWKARLGFAIKGKPLNIDSLLLDFNLRTGKIGNGAKAAKRAYIGWLLVPFLVLSILSGILDDLNQIANNVALAQEIGKVAGAIAPFALIIIGLSFVWGFYPRGSFGRLTFGLLKVPFILLFVNAIFLNGALEQALWSSNLKLDLAPIVELFLIYAALVALLPICELIDYRREWKYRVGRKLRPLSPPQKGLLTDFKLRYARLVEGAKNARRTFRSYIIIPVVLVLAIRAAVTSLNEPILNQAIQGLQDLDSTVIAIGVVLVVVQFCRGSYRAGAFSRLCFGAIAAVLIVLWTYVFFTGMTRVNTLFEVPGTPVQVDLSPFLQLFLIIMLIWSAVIGLRYLLEYGRHRSHWLESRESWVVYGNEPVAPSEQ
ncbi:MAG: hypothetical protein LUO85_02435 [Methanomassiliicoccales archaeon]|nr:hypothetical protein [Methanomassiliicoccales archaeon]